VILSRGVMRGALAGEAGEHDPALGGSRREQRVKGSGRPRYRGTSFEACATRGEEPGPGGRGDVSGRRWDRDEGTGTSRRGGRVVRRLASKPGEGSRVPRPFFMAQGSEKRSRIARQGEIDLGFGHAWVESAPTGEQPGSARRGLSERFR
jgi:hypothetical protein